MVRNFSTMNRRPFMPIRSCLNNAGPLLERRIAAATKSIGMLITISPIEDRTISVARLTMASPGSIAPPPKPVRRKENVASAGPRSL